MKINPKCLPDPGNKDFEPMPLAIDNRGHLLPCCWCDHPKTTKSELFKEIYSVSKLTDYKSIDDILDTKQWQKFEDDLVQARDKGDNLEKINQTCLHHCQARAKNDKIKIETYYEKGEKKVVEEK